jgi:hypothetical protein
MREWNGCDPNSMPEDVKERYRAKQAKSKIIIYLCMIVFGLGLRFGDAIVYSLYKLFLFAK